MYTTRYVLYSTAEHTPDKCTQSRVASRRVAVSLDDPFASFQPACYSTSQKKKLSQVCGILYSVLLATSASGACLRVRVRARCTAWHTHVLPSACHCHETTGVLRHATPRRQNSKLPKLRPIPQIYKSIELL